MNKLAVWWYDVKIVTVLAIIRFMSKDAYAVMCAAFDTYDAQAQALFNHVFDPNGDNEQASIEEFQLSLKAEQAITTSVSKFLHNRER